MFNVFINNLYEWQTLASGILALIGAIITVYFLTRQIKIQKSQIKKYDDEKRDINLVRSFRYRNEVCIELHEMEDYARKCLNKHLLNPETRIRPPVKLLTSITNSIEYLDINSARYMFHMMNTYQIHEARMKEHYENRVTSDKIALSYNAIILSKMSNNIYKYARNQSNEIQNIKVSKGDIEREYMKIKPDNWLDIEVDEMIIQKIERKIPTTMNIIDLSLDNPAHNTYFIS